MTPPSEQEEEEELLLLHNNSNIMVQKNRGGTAQGLTWSELFLDLSESGPRVSEGSADWEETLGSCVWFPVDGLIASSPSATNQAADSPTCDWQQVELSAADDGAWSTSVLIITSPTAVRGQEHKKKNTAASGQAPTSASSVNKTKTET